MMKEVKCASLLPLLFWFSKQLLGKSLMFVFIFIEVYQGLIGGVILGWEIWVFQVLPILSPEFSKVISLEHIQISLLFFNENNDT